MNTEYENMSLFELYQASMTGKDREATKELQTRVGVAPDGVYGPNTEAAYVSATSDYTQLPNYPTPESTSAVAAGAGAAASSSASWLPYALMAGGSVLSAFAGRSEPSFGPRAGNASLGELMKFYEGASDVSLKAPSKRGGFTR